MSAYPAGMKGFFLGACLAAVLAGPCPAFDLSMEDDRLTVRADRTPLRALLQRFADRGVRVQMDPAIDVLVTGSCDREPLDTALDALLDPFAYVLTWETVPGPVAELPRLSEIQVFLPGAKDRIRPLDSAARRLELVRGPLPDSPLFVADEILVRVRSGARPDEFRQLLRQLGASVVASVPEFGIYQLRLAPGVNIPALAEQLNRNPLLERAEPNYADRLPRPSPETGASAARAQAPAPPASEAAPLAILDSGLLGGVGLDGVVVGTFDAVFPDNAMADPRGHGTQMALIAAGAVPPAGAGASNEGVPLLAVRAFDGDGATSNFALMRAIRYALEQGARVINLSWGTATRSEFIAEAIAHAQSRGAVVVAAAGNEPTGRAMYPAAYPGVVAVSALNADASPWDRSNYGDFVAVAAPGRASLPVGHDGPPGAYAGTSIASAYVARELALYFARNPTADGDEARRALRDAVTDAGEKGRDPVYGHGALDAAARSRLRN